MAGDDELEPTVSALEEQVGDLTERVAGTERDAAAARILAGAADRDVSEIQSDMREMRQEFGDLRAEMRQEFGNVRAEMRQEFTNVRAEFRDFRNATTASFNAQRQDFVDLRTHVDEQFARVDDGFTEMRARFDATATGQQQIVDLLHTLIGDGGQ